MPCSAIFSGRFDDLGVFLREVFDFSSVLKDINTSRRKKIFFGTYFAIASVIAFIVVQYGKSFQVYAESEIWCLFILLLAIEPVFLVTQAIILGLFPMELNPIAAKTKEDNHRIGVIITCHRSEDDIVDTVHACLNHFDPSQIFIIDNSNNEDEGHETLKALHDADLHCVNYIFQMIGNKTLALYAGAIAAKQFDFLVSCHVFFSGNL